MDPLEESRDLNARPLPPLNDGEKIVEVPVDYTVVDDDMVLSSIYEIDQQVKSLQADIQQLQQQRVVLMDRAIMGGIRTDRFCELVEVPAKKFRILDAERIQKDWPDLCAQAAEIEYRKAKEKIAQGGPTLKTLEAVMGKARVDQYCTPKQGPSTYNVIPRGRY